VRVDEDGDRKSVAKAVEDEQAVGMGEPEYGERSQDGKTPGDEDDPSEEPAQGVNRSRENEGDAGKEDGFKGEDKTNQKEAVAVHVVIIIQADEIDAYAEGVLDGSARGRRGCVHNGKQMSDWEQGVVAIASLTGLEVMCIWMILALIRWVSGEDHPTLHGVVLAVIKRAWGEDGTAGPEARPTKAVR
jgi:hypothetical protein